MRLATVARWIKTQALGWNLFESPESLTDNFQLRIAIVSTRIYACVLLLVVINFIMFASLMTFTQTIVVEKPSRNTYTALYDKYSRSLKCPCKNIAIRYESFIKISMQYHPVCTSWFISDIWKKRSFNETMYAFDANDFRIIAVNYLQLLDIYCGIARKSVQSSVDDFLSEALLTKNLLAASSLNIHIDEEIIFTLTVTANRIQQHNAFVQKTFHSNQFQTIFQTPKTMFYLVRRLGSPEPDGLYFHPRIIGANEKTSCNCVEQSACSTQAMYFSEDGEM